MRKFILKAIIASTLLFSLSSCTGQTNQAQTQEYINQIVEAIRQQSQSSTVSQNQQITSDTQSQPISSDTTSQATSDTTQSQQTTDNTQNQTATNSQPTQNNQTTRQSVTQTNNIQQNTGYIGEDKAKAIAVEHAGLTVSGVNFAYVKLDYDYPTAKYEVEFWANNTEYDYDINATTGAILSYDYDMEYNNYANNNIPNTNVSITQDQAKSTALQHANLSQSQVTFAKAYLDYDDGRAEYEIEFYANNTKYEYTINASTGNIIDFEMEQGR